MGMHDAVSGVRKYEIDRRSTTFGLVTSAIFHLLMVGSYYLAGNKMDEGFRPPIFADPPFELTLEPKTEKPVINAGMGYLPHPHGRIGIPITLPDSDALWHEIVDPIFDAWEDVPTISGPVNESTDQGFGTGSAGTPNGTIAIDDEEPPEFIPGIEHLPEPIKKVAPIYPEIARQAGIEGKVYLKILVTKEGKVRKVSVVKSDNDIFDLVAMDAAAQWVFIPGMMKAGPVAVWVKMPFEFRLNK